MWSGKELSMVVLERDSQNVPLSSQPRATASHRLATLLEMQVLRCNPSPSGTEIQGHPANCV